MDQSDIDRLAESAERARESTIKRLKLVPQGKENTGVPDGVMSPADIADHLIHADKVLVDLPATRFKGKDLGLTRQKVVVSRSEYDDLVAELGKLSTKRSEFIRGLTDADLRTSIRFEAIAGKGEMDLGAMLHRYLDHECHHRGALSVYLRLYEAGF